MGNEIDKHIEPSHYTEMKISPLEYIEANPHLTWSLANAINPLISEDSKHYQILDTDSIKQFEKMFTTAELMAWAKLNYYKYMFRLGKKDSVEKDMKKMKTYEAYWKTLSKLQIEGIL